MLIKKYTYERMAKGSLQFRNALDLKINAMQVSLLI